MEILDNATRERFNMKIKQIQAAQRTARARIKDIDSTRFDIAMQEAEQGVRDLERMVA
jgi:hypothetical protein